MDAYNRDRLLTLYGQLLTGSRKVEDIDRELRAIVADERARGYDLGVRDVKRGRWGK